MGEFIPTLVAGTVILVVLWAASQFPGSGMTGAFIAGDREQTQIISDTTIYSTVYRLAETQGNVEKGNGIAVPFNVSDGYDNGLLEFQVERAGSGTLDFRVNGQSVWSGQPERGKFSVEFDPDILIDSSILSITATDWPWSSPQWTVKAAVYGEQMQGAQATFEGRPNARNAQLDMEIRSEGWLTIRLNGQEIFSGIPNLLASIKLDAKQLKDFNTVEFIPQPRSRHTIDWAKVVFEK